MDEGGILKSPLGRPIQMKVVLRPSESSPSRVRCTFFGALTGAEVNTAIRRGVIDVQDEIDEKEEYLAEVCNFRLEMN